MVDRPVTYHILAPSDEQFLRKLLDIYDRSILAVERKPAEALRAMLARPDYRFILARDEAGMATGFAALFANEDVAILEYLAVAPDRRSTGVGSSLFRHCAAMVGVPLLVEVDSPDHPGADRPDRERRVAFYRRLGCRQFAGLTYHLPLADNPPPMGLYLYAPAPPTSVPMATLRRYLVTLYTGVYSQSADDPRILAMLAGLPDPVPLV